MSTQDSYDRANAELRAAIAARTQGDSNNHAILACALYLRSITEMLGVKFKGDTDGKS